MTRITFICLLATLLCACGGGGGAAPPASTSAPTSNTLAVTVDAGPSNSSTNQLFTSVTICKPGSSTVCQTIDHILVDTGSSGLRLLSSLVSPAVVQNRVLAANSRPLLNCVQFLDGSYAWGPVASADVILGSKKASNVSVQLIADAAFTSVNSACSSSGTGTLMNSVSSIGAKGILGVGHLPQDCGAGCSTTAANGYYFTCTDATCSSTVGSTASLSQQLNNPVPLFASDNNGLIIDLPAVSSAGVLSLKGSMIFGIGTQTNNQFTSGSVLTTDSAGLVRTVFEGRTLGSSFIDTGSNGLFFDTSTLPTCSTATGFYCPTSTTTLAAILVGANAAASALSFQVGNAETLFNTSSNAVLPALAGPAGTSNIFDWGLPFFYGRRVFIGFQNQTSPLGTGPLFAF